MCQFEDLEMSILFDIRITKYYQMKITVEMTKAAFKVAKNVYEKKNSRKEGIENLHSSHGMNKGTASDLISNFNYMMNGERYARTLNAYTTEYFLNNIHADYGVGRLKNALTALYKHFTYYEGIRNTTRHTIRAIYDKYRTYILTDPIIQDDLNEQEEIIDKYKTKSREQLLAELNAIYLGDNKKIEKKHSGYKRINKAIGIIKILRGFKCQICNSFILKKNGDYYTEAAHIIPHHKKGEATLGNIILLCPNHHKEFDLGNTIDIEVKENILTFIMNEKYYEVKLSIDV